MLQSKIFTKIRHKSSSDEISISAQFLTRGGFIFKNMAGVYSFLPLGVRVMDKIRNIIRREMNNIGAQEVYLNNLQDKSVWDKTGRWNIENTMYSWKDNGRDFGLGFTHEEVVAQIGSQYISSYKDLPQFVYQIQKKFRKEIRVQAGLLRNREFEMKDLYSLTKDEKSLKDFYEKCAGAYARIFKIIKLRAIRTRAHGGVFSSDGSEEFQVVADVGEDTIYICQNCERAMNKEVINKNRPICSYCSHDKFEEKRSIEVGNIFQLGTKFSKPLGLFYTDEKGTKQEVWMGSYGIGTSRLMATIAEIHNDERGIIWPESVAPFKIHLIQIENNKKVKKAAEKLYWNLQKQNYEILYDDREDKTAGEKFAEADLIGIPIRLVISERTLANGSVEIKKRNKRIAKLIKLEKVKKNVE